MNHLTPLLADWAPLLADFGEWIKPLVMVIGIVIWVMSQLISNMKTAEAKGPPPEVDWDDDEEEDYGEGQPARAGVSSNEPSQEIEAFLRRIRGDQAPPAPAPIQQPLPVERAPLSETLDQQASVFDKPLAEEDTTDRFAHRASHMGDEVRDADEVNEERMHEVFDHAVGRMQDTSMGVPGKGSSEKEFSHEQEAVFSYDTGTAKAAPSMASEIRDMFSDPQSVKKAVILNEVLTRPEQRW